MSNASLAKECVHTQKVYSQVEYVFALSTCSTKQFVNYVLVRCYIREFAIYVKVHFYVFLCGMDLITCVASVFGGEILGTKLCVKKSISITDRVFPASEDVDDVGTESPQLDNTVHHGRRSDITGLTLSPCRGKFIYSTVSISGIGKWFC